MLNETRIKLNDTSKYIVDSTDCSNWINIEADIVVYNEQAKNICIEFEGLGISLMKDDLKKVLGMINSTEDEFKETSELPKIVYQPQPLTFRQWFTNLFRPKVTLDQDDMGNYIVKVYGMYLWETLTKNKHKAESSYEEILRTVIGRKPKKAYTFKTVKKY